MDSLPLNASGKVDRAALLKSGCTPGTCAGQRPQSWSRRQNQLERDLAMIWQQVLGLERVSIHDNFFDLGGHSLLMAQAHSRLQEHLGREVPIVDLFRYPTIHLLAATWRLGPAQAAHGQRSPAGAGTGPAKAPGAATARSAQRGHQRERMLQRTPPRKGGR